MANTRRGFPTMPINQDADDEVLDISRDFDENPSIASYGEPGSFALEASSNKRKARHLDGDHRRDSATPSGPARKQSRTSTSTSKRDGPDDDGASDVSGDIFAGDQQPVSTHNTYAHHLKKKLGFNHEEFPDPTGKGIIKPRRIPAQDDPENHAIKNLRVKEKLSWADITSLINAERIKKGAVPDLTEAATYSRFVRNAPRIAAQEGDNDFDVKDFMHLKPKEMGKLDLSVKAAVGGDDGENGKGGGKKKWSRKADEILVSSYKAAKEEFWMVVAEKFELQSGRTVTPVECAKRFKLL